MELPLRCPGMSRALAFGGTPNSRGLNLVRKPQPRQMAAASYFDGYNSFILRGLTAAGHGLLKTSAGLRPSAVKVPASPSKTVTATAVSAAPAACPATKT